MSTGKRNYFEHDKLDLRKLRHDLASAIQVVGLMARFSDEKPEKREEYLPLLRDGIKRLEEIQEALCDNNANNILQGEHLIEVTHRN